MDKIKQIFSHHDKTETKSGDDTSGNYANTGFDESKYRQEHGSSAVPAYQRGQAGEYLDRTQHTSQTTGSNLTSSTGHTGGYSSTDPTSASTTSGYGSTTTTGGYGTVGTQGQGIVGRGEEALGVGQVSRDQYSSTSGGNDYASTGSTSGHGSSTYTGEKQRVPQNFGDAPVSTSGSGSRDQYASTGATSGSQYGATSGNQYGATSGSQYDQSNTTLGTHNSSSGQQSSTGIHRGGVAEAAGLEGLAESDKAAAVRAYEASHGEGTSGRVGEAISGGNFSDEISGNNQSSQSQQSRSLGTSGQQSGDYSSSTGRQDEYSSSGRQPEYNSSSSRGQEYATGATGGTSGLGSNSGAAVESSYDYTSGSADTTRLGQSSGQEYSQSSGLGVTSGLTGTSTTTTTYGSEPVGQVLPGPAHITGHVVTERDPEFREVVQELRSHEHGIGGSAFTTGATTGLTSASSYETGSGLAGSRDGYGQGDVYDSSYSKTSSSGQGIVGRAEQAVSSHQNSGRTGEYNSSSDTSSSNKPGLVERAKEAVGMGSTGYESQQSTGRTGDYSSTSGSTGQGYGSQYEKSSTTGQSHTGGSSSGPGLVERAKEAVGMGGATSTSGTGSDSQYASGRTSEGVTSSSGPGYGSTRDNYSSTAGTDGYPTSTSTGEKSGTYQRIEQSLGVGSASHGNTGSEYSSTHGNTSSGLTGSSATGTTGIGSGAHSSTGISSSTHGSHAHDSATETSTANTEKKKGLLGKIEGALGL